MHSTKKAMQLWNYLWNAVGMCDDADDVVEWQQRVALDLRVDILALSAQRQQLHEADVVRQWAGCIQPVALRPHQFQQHCKRVAVVVEQQNFFTNVDQLRKRKKERKSIYIVPYILCIVRKVLRHGSHSFTCKLRHACLSFVAFTRGRD